MKFLKGYNFNIIYEYFLNSYTESQASSQVIYVSIDKAEKNMVIVIIIFFSQFHNFHPSNQNTFSLLHQIISTDGLYQWDKSIY